MTRERRQQIEEVSSLLLPLGTAERAARLDLACANDPELRREWSHCWRRRAAPIDFWKHRLWRLPRGRWRGTSPMFWPGAVSVLIASKACLAPAAWERFITAGTPD